MHDSKWDFGDQSYSIVWYILLDQGTVYTKILTIQIQQGLPRGVSSVGNREECKGLTKCRDREIHLVLFGRVKITIFD